MKNFSFLTKSWIGLDIQKTAIKLVELSKIKNAYIIEQAFSIPLPQGVMTEGKIKSWESLRSILSEWIKKLKLTGCKTVINLPANLVRMQRLQLPLGMPESAILIEIRAQVERDFPGLIDSLYIDFIVSEHKVAGFANVFFAATRSEYVSKLIECMNSAGLNVKIVDIDIYAIKRIFDLARDPPKAQSHAFLKEGKTNDLNAIICNHNNLISLIIYEIYEIIFYQQWDFSDKINFMSNLKSKLQLFFAIVPDKIIKNVAIYNIEFDIKDIFAEINFTHPFKIYLPKPFSRIHFSEKINPQNMENINQYLLAVGGAIREMPAW